MSASTQTAKKNTHPSSSKQGHSVPNSYQQLRNRCPGCHVDVHMEKRARETTVDPDQRQHQQFTDGYIGASTLHRDGTMIGGRPDTPETERILSKLTRSDPVTTRTLMPIGTEGEPLLSRRKKATCDSERSSPPYKSTLESALRAEGEMPMDTGTLINVSASSSYRPAFPSAITNSVERNDVDMVQASVNNEGQKSTDTPKDTREAPMSVATEEVTPLLGGSPRLDHQDLDPLHRVRDRPEYKYSKLSLQMPTTLNAAANAQGEGVGGSGAIAAGESAAAAADGSRAEGVEESPAPSPVPTLERRKTELVWRS